MNKTSEIRKDIHCPLSAFFAPFVLAVICTFTCYLVFEKEKCFLSVGIVQKYALVSQYDCIVYQHHTNTHSCTGCLVRFEAGCTSHTVTNTLIVTVYTI